MLVPTNEFQQLSYWMDRSDDKGQLDGTDVLDSWRALNAAMITPAPQAMTQAEPVAKDLPASPTEWRLRWYGSPPMKGWSLIAGRNAEVACFGDRAFESDLQAVVNRHNQEIARLRIESEQAKPVAAGDSRQLAGWLLTSPESGTRLSFAGPLETIGSFSRVRLQDAEGNDWTLTARLSEGYKTPEQMAETFWKTVEEESAQPPQPEPVAVDTENLAHEIWSSAQLSPGEGIEDAVARISALLQQNKPVAVSDAIRLIDEAMRLPTKPLPDPLAHSHEAYAHALHSAFCAIRFKLIDAKAALASAQPVANNDGIKFCAPFPGMEEPWSDEKIAELKTALEAYNAPTSQPAQPAEAVSIPEGWRLVKQERIAAIMKLIAYDKESAYEGRGLYNEQAVHRNWNKADSALTSIRDEIDGMDADAEWDLPDACAAPVESDAKKGGQS